ncbi:MAG: hypothetical protein K8S98_08460 [Planctomycetes bacterium]|nr:hypothetical protein [Planctomycetota bacterium]
MKSMLILSLVLPLAFVGACQSVGGGNKTMPPEQAKAAFERLKSLEGRWTGQANHGGDPFPVEVTYHVTAAGSAVEEKLFAGTEHEMVTMYHMDGEHLMLTHYCAAGNQPSMVARWDPNMDVIKFTFVGATNMKSENEMHMHSGVIRFLGSDNLEATWSGMSDGKPAGDAHFMVARAK